MKSLETHFDAFMAAYPQAEPALEQHLRVAFHAGAMAVCTMFANADSSQYSEMIKELQQEEHAFGKKEL